MPTITISIDDNIKKIIDKRAKKSLLTTKEQIEEIVRMSAIRTKAGTGTGNFSTDDKLVEVFSRKRKGKKK